MVLNTKFTNNLMSLTSVDRISNYSGSACGAVIIWKILRPVYRLHQNESPIPKLYYRWGAVKRDAVSQSEDRKSNQNRG